jgi:adenylylsulfate kinase-like enzyme
LQATYEPPLQPDIVVQGDRDDPEEAARRIVEVLVRKKFLRNVKCL